MKKIFTIIITLIMMVVATSCSNIFNVVDRHYNSYEEVANAIGDVSRIIDPTSARFVTGQILNGNDFFCDPDGGHNDVVFEGHLVEYNQVRQEILSYIESTVDEPNGLVHQLYRDVNYEPEKVYVELCTYTDIVTGEILVNEIRMFTGAQYLNYVPTVEDSGYAYCATFNANFSFDYWNWQATGIVL